MNFIRELHSTKLKIVMSSFETPENFRENSDVKIGSNRSFGFVFTVVFALLAGYAWTTESEQYIVALGFSGLFFILACLAQNVLAPLNQLWFRFGQLLHKIVSPIIMGVIFFLCILPIGLLMRLFGKRPLSLNFDKSAKSYWVHRTPPSPEPESMKRQF